MGITLDHWRKTHLALAILVTAFLAAVVKLWIYSNTTVIRLTPSNLTNFSNPADRQNVLPSH